MLLSASAFISCEETADFDGISGPDWELTTSSIGAHTAFQYYRGPQHGLSKTLYVGQFDNSDRTAYSLLTFTAIDSTLLAAIDSIEILVFPRYFAEADSLAEGSQYYLKGVQGLDSLWTDTDTNVTAVDTSNGYYTAPAVVQVDSIGLFDGTYTSVPHLRFRIDSTIVSRWRTDFEGNYAFVLTAEPGLPVLAFHSAEASRTPYLQISFTDTTGGDTLVVSSARAARAGISIYESQYHVNPDGQILFLSRGNGANVHFDFSDSLVLDIEHPPVAGRLIFQVNRDSSRIYGESILVALNRMDQDFAEGDTLQSLFTGVGYTTGADSIVFHLGDLLLSYLSGSRKNYGINLSISPILYDPDELAIWGTSDAVPAALRPRLEIIHAAPYRKAD